jgi:subtilisin family serine protease
MRRLKAFAVLLGVVSATFATATPALADDKDKLVERIVATADPSLLQVAVTTRRAHGVPRVDTIRVPDIAAAKRVVRDMLGRPDVAVVAMDHRVKAAGFSDPYYIRQWALDTRHLRFASVYSLTRYDQPHVKIAVIDSGAQSSHPDLVGHVISGYNAINPGSAPSDDCGHGTHVAGIIGARVNNSTGVVGFAQRAYVRPVKALQNSLVYGCSGYGSDIANGIYWAAASDSAGTHAQIISMSLESDQYDATEANAVAYAQSRGLVVVAAAGNGGGSQVAYPAGYANVVGVGAVGSSSSYPYWAYASFTNHGYWVDVAAPGVNILSTVPPSNPDCPSSEQLSSGYCYMSGTSMATPYVAATIALAMQHCHWSGRTAVSWMQRTASSYPSKSIYTGYGFINPVKLLRCGS